MTVQGRGFVSARTTGAGPIRAGYATVRCDVPVSGQLNYSSYDPLGNKIAEATVLPTGTEASSYRILVDGRDNARLGLAVANNTDLPRTYDLTLRTEEGRTRSTGLMTVSARSNAARFVDELVAPPPASGGVYLLEVRSSDESVFSMIGLRFTGPVFSVVPAVAPH